MNKKIELKIQDITCTQTSAHAYAMLLKEVNGDRQIPVIIGATEAQSIMLYMGNLKSPRPLTHDLMYTCLTALDAKLLRVLIYAVKDGIFYAHLYLKHNENFLCIDSRTSDAVALAIRMDAPILIYESILESEKLMFDTEEQTEQNGQQNAPEGSIDPVTATPWKNWNGEKLQNRMNQAIEEEDYELAAKLRDEINLRH